MWSSGGRGGGSWSSAAHGAQAARRARRRARRAVRVEQDALGGSGTQQGHKVADTWAQVAWQLWATVVLVAGLARGEGKWAEPKKNSNFFYLFKKFQ
jgi:hypothetical protein